MAKAGSVRPSQRSKDPEEKIYDKALCRYVSTESSYDKDFDKEIRRLRPDWFAE